jgi:hypothetical protein
MSRVDTRKARRRNREDCQAVMVRVVCDRCGGLLAELYGTTEVVSAYWSRKASGHLGAYGRVVRWRCSRGHDHPARAEKLTTAYRSVATLSERQRVIRLPRDIAGVPGTGPFGDPI